jgi:UDP-N-acetylglucosamine 2-epimerase (hydrolysing)
LKILVSVGTRPEAIKLAPVIDALKGAPEIETSVCLTGQHPDMAGSALREFGITGDTALQVDPEDATLTDRFSQFQRTLGRHLLKTGPDWVIVHGDTTSTFASALAAFHNNVKVAHVEAGLRTRDIANPWPEEAYRRMTAVVTDTHFAPTQGAADNLVAEGVEPERIIVTGNTAVDALYGMQDRISKDRALGRRLEGGLRDITQARPHVLVTAHRRENHGAPMRHIAESVAGLSRLFPGYVFIFPVHPHPDVGATVRAALSHLENVKLTGPLDYLDFLFALASAKLVLSDSGGVQEEAATFGTPLLVLRDVTERPEALEAGTAKLVGTEKDTIMRQAERVLRQSSSEHGKMDWAGNPFGDGRAAQRISRHFRNLALTDSSGSFAPVAPIEEQSDASALD